MKRVVNQCNIVYLRSRRISSRQCLGLAGAGFLCCILTTVAWLALRETEVKLDINVANIPVIHLEVHTAAAADGTAAADSAVFGGEDFSVEVKTAAAWADAVTDGDLSPLSFEYMQLGRSVNSQASWASSHNLSCILAHAAAWRAVREATQPSIVLAPGASLVPAAQDIIQTAAASLPLDFSLLLLAGDEPLAPPSAMAAQRWPGGAGTRAIRGAVHPCDTSYLLSPLGATHLLSNLFPIRQDLQGLLLETMDLWKHRMAATAHAAATTGGSGSGRTTPSMKQHALGRPHATPRMLFVLCGGASASEAQCEQDARLASRLHVLQRHVQSAPGQQPWQLQAVIQASVLAAMADMLPGVDLGSVSDAAAAAVACAAVLGKSGGGMCIAQGGQLLRDPAPYLDVDEVVVGMGVEGGLTPAMTIASASAVAGALGSFMRRVSSDPSCVAHAGGVLGVWKGLAAGGANVMVLPALLTDPLPALTPPPAELVRGGGEAIWPLLDPFPAPALTTWRDGAAYGGAGSIPRVLHFIWLGKTVPANKLRLMRTWLQQHPGWQVRVWRDEHVAQLQSAFVIGLCDDPKQKADVARYEIVWRYGGVYVDMDFESIRSLEAVVRGGWSGVVCHESPPPVDQHSLSNGFFAFTQGHPAMRRAMLFALRAKRNTDFVHLMTGPRMFRLALDADMPSVLHLPTPAMYPVTFGQRQSLRDLHCHSQSCAEHFPGSLALHVWSLASDPVDSRLPATELDHAAGMHNSKWRVQDLPDTTAATTLHTQEQAW